MTQAEPDAAAAAALRLALADPALDTAGFMDIVRGGRLPQYTESIDEPYQGIVTALNQVVDRAERRAMRRACARRLAAVIAALPELETELPWPGKVLFNVYSLAGALAEPDALADALRQEVDRQEAIRLGAVTSRVAERDLNYMGYPARRFLLYGLISNQNDSRFA